VRDDDYQSLYD
jgi:hypothetical protein